MGRVSLVVFFLLLVVFTGVFAGNKPPSRRRPPPASGRPPPPPPVGSPPRRIPTQVWCVARRDVSTKKLKNFRDYACRRERFGLDCSPIAPGRPCNFEKDHRKQASYVLNLYFVRHHTCWAEYGTYAHVDPSEGGCRFPRINLND